MHMDRYLKYLNTRHLKQYNANSYRVEHYKRVRAIELGTSYICTSVGYTRSAASKIKWVAHTMR